MTETQPKIRVATDIGGTFTDIVLEINGELITTKLLTTSAAPEVAVIDGTRTVLADASVTFSDVDVMLHGTTLATNAIIERKGARTALITTDGFRDVLEIADESRYDQYDVFLTKPSPLVPRDLRFTVTERVDVEGNVLRALDETAVAAAAESLKSANVESVAIVFLHSYVNPQHEQRAGEIIRRICPEIEVTVSSDVCPEAREYERSTTALCNAYVQPLMAGYLTRLQEKLNHEGYTKDVHLMTSGGSLCGLDTACQFPIRLVESGPAGGAMLAAGLAGERGEDHILSFDMGGTTAKICLIEEGEPLKARAFEVDRRSRFMKGSGMPVRIPVIEMIEIGAGGGSIATVDALKRIEVGPESAGSDPGPASYGLGGTQPTVTDADVVLGKIDPARFAGGRIPIDAELAEAAVETVIGKPLSMSAENGAYGIAEVVDENMANAARVHAIERGVSISGRTLIAFGGAAPLHASRLAEKLNIDRIIVPSGAGVGSAIGFLNAPAAYELVRSRYMRLTEFDPAAVLALFNEMSVEATALTESAAQGRPLTERRGAYMRYTGQGHEIFVGIPKKDLSATHGENIRSEFEAAYRHLFKRHIPDSDIEIMSWSLLVTTEGREQKMIPRTTDAGPATPAAQRDVFDPSLATRVKVDVHYRSDISIGQRITGPAIIIEDSTSTLVSTSFDAHVDAGEALVLTRKTATH